MQRYLLVEPNLHSFGVLEEPKLELFTERHHFRLPALPMSAVSSIAREIGAHNEAGVIFSLTTGLPGRRHLQLAGHSLRRSQRVFFHWPYEEAIEVIDRERLGSLWRHWAAYNAAVRLRPGPDASSPSIGDPRAERVAVTQGTRNASSRMMWDFFLSILGIRGRIS